MKYIGVDLGGTGIKAGVVTQEGEILSKGSKTTRNERHYSEIIADIAALCEEVVRSINCLLSVVRLLSCVALLWCLPLVP